MGLKICGGLQEGEKANAKYQSNLGKDVILT